MSGPNRDLTTWRKKLNDMLDEGEQVIAYAPDEAAFDVEFDDGYGLTEGPAVLAWTATHVYFPVRYDGAESLRRAPRNPQADGQSHVGGG